MRINSYVLDNNIWISYFITNRQQKIVDIIDKNGLTVFSCDELIAEFTSVLKYEHIQKYKVSVPRSVGLLKEITTHFTVKYPIKNYIPDDVKDNYVIALALQTNSGFITSGDSHILSQKKILERKYTKLKIITKTEFEEKFG
jgi:putative PIN family toxin of toxin-antitoxin system